MEQHQLSSKQINPVKRTRPRAPNKSTQSTDKSTPFSVDFSVFQAFSDFFYIIFRAFLGFREIFGIFHIIFSRLLGVPQTFGRHSCRGIMFIITPLPRRVHHTAPTVSQTPAATLNTSGRLGWVEAPARTQALRELSKYRFSITQVISRWLKLPRAFRKKNKKNKGTSYGNNSTAQDVAALHYLGGTAVWLDYAPFEKKQTPLKKKHVRSHITYVEYA